MFRRPSESYTLPLMVTSGNMCFSLMTMTQMSIKCLYFIYQTHTNPKPHSKKQTPQTFQTFNTSSTNKKKAENRGRCCGGASASGCVSPQSLGRMNSSNVCRFDSIQGSSGNLRGFFMHEVWVVGVSSYIISTTPHFEGGSSFFEKTRLRNLFVFFSSPKKQTPR